MQNKLEIYAEKYVNPDDGMKVDERLLEILSSRVMKYVKGPKVLEMGVGAGTYTNKIIDKFGISYVVDGSNKLLEKQKSIYKNDLVIYNSYFEEFKSDLKFDTILATNVLEHVDDPVLVLKNMKNCLNEDGEILIIVPNANSLHRNYGKTLNIIKDLTQLGESDFKIGHKRVYTAELLEQHIKDAGLKVKSKLPTFIKLLSNSQMNNFTDFQLEGLFLLAERLDKFLDYDGDIFMEVVK